MIAHKLFSSLSVTSILVLLFLCLSQIQPTHSSDVAEIKHQNHQHQYRNQLARQHQQFVQLRAAQLRALEQQKQEQKQQQDQLKRRQVNSRNKLHRLKGKRSATAACLSLVIDNFSRASLHLNSLSMDTGSDGTMGEAFSSNTIQLTPLSDLSYWYSFVGEGGCFNASGWAGLRLQVVGTFPAREFRVGIQTGTPPNCVRSQKYFSPITAATFTQISPYTYVDLPFSLFGIPSTSLTNLLAIELSAFGTTTFNKTFTFAGVSFIGADCLSVNPTSSPTTAPSTAPTTSPTTSPSTAPSTAPTTSPSTAPTTSPTTSPSTSPSTSPTSSPTSGPDTSSPTTSSPTTSSPTSTPVACSLKIDNFSGQPQPNVNLLTFDTGSDGSMSEVYENSSLSLTVTNDLSYWYTVLGGEGCYNASNWWGLRFRLGGSPSDLPAFEVGVQSGAGATCLQTQANFVSFQSGTFTNFGNEFIVDFPLKIFPNTSLDSILAVQFSGFTSPSFGKKIVLKEVSLITQQCACSNQVVDDFSQSSSHKNLFLQGTGSDSTMKEEYGVGSLKLTPLGPDSYWYTSLAGLSCFDGSAWSAIRFEFNGVIPVAPSFRLGVQIGDSLCHVKNSTLFVPFSIGVASFSPQTNIQTFDFSFANLGLTPNQIQHLFAVELSAFTTTSFNRTMDFHKLSFVSRACLS